MAKKRFDPKGRCGQILKEIERLFPSVNLWLEWSPPRIVARHNGFFLRKIKGNGWKLALNMTGEPRHVVRVSDVDEAEIARIRNLIENMIGTKPKETTMETNVGQPPAAEEPPEEQSDKRAKTTAEPDLVLLAIEEIILGENTQPDKEGYYCVEHFNNKVLEIVMPDANRAAGEQALRHTAAKLVKSGRLLELLRKGKERRVRVKLSAESLQRMKQTVVVKKPPVAQPAIATPVSLPVATITPISPAAQALATLRATSFEELHKLKKEKIKGDPILVSLIKHLLLEE